MPDGPNEDDDERRSQKTYRGFAHPGVDEPPRTEEPMFEDRTEYADPPPMGLDPPIEHKRGDLLAPPAPRSIHDETPLVEIEVVHQHGPAPRMEQPAQTLEVWTQNRVYTMDASLHCVLVTDRESDRSDAHHPFIGHKLVGGQHRENDTFELSYPFPRPGTEAVFEHPTGSRGQFSRTSTVHRVVLRLHVITVAPSRLVPTWADITNHEIALPPEKIE